MIPACWISNDNFGDALTPYLIKKISGEDAKFTPLECDKHKFLVTGSILATKHAKNATIWGAGIVNKNEPVYKAKKLLAVRGPLSKRNALVHNKEPIAIGDPGTLLPFFYNPNVRIKHDIGIIPSWIDYSIVKKKYPNHRIINIIGDVEKIVRNILECESTICSCLHGLIACAAYRIPTRWVKFSDRVIGDGTKFHDFLMSINTDYEVTDLRGCARPIKKLPFHHPISNLDRQALLNCCPF